MRVLVREVSKIKALLLVSTIVCLLLCHFYEKNIHEDGVK